MIGTCLANPIRSAGQVWLDQYRRPFYEHYRHGAYEAAWELAQIIRAQTPADAVIIVPASSKMERVLTYWSDRWVIGSDSPIADRFRRHAVFVVLLSDAASERQSFEALGLRRIKELVRTASVHRQGERLILARARWKAQAPSAPATEP
jgi:hypothetical protein